MPNLSHNERAVAFMRMKANMLPAGLRNKYFNNQDAIAIMEWPEDATEAAMQEIFDEVSFDYFRGGSTCPFCIYSCNKNIECSDCDYGENHGNCMYPGSHWHALKLDRIMPWEQTKIPQEVMAAFRQFFATYYPEWSCVYENE